MITKKEGLSMKTEHKTRLIIFVIILIIFVLGVAIFGPKFITKLQMEFGLKAKIELIEECIPMPGCAITTEELELYKHYKMIKKTKTYKELEETELGEFLLKEGLSEGQ